MVMATRKFSGCSIKCNRKKEVFNAKTQRFVDFLRKSKIGFFLLCVLASLRLCVKIPGSNHFPSYSSSGSVGFSITISLSR